MPQGHNTNERGISNQWIMENSLLLGGEGGGSSLKNDIPQFCHVVAIVIVLPKWAPLSHNSAVVEMTRRSWPNPHAFSRISIEKSSEICPKFKSAYTLSGRVEFDLLSPPSPLKSFWTKHGHDPSFQLLPMSVVRREKNRILGYRWYMQYLTTWSYRPPVNTCFN